MELLFIIILLFFSAYFSGCETSVTAVSEATIHKLKKEGNKRASIIMALRENKNSLIGTLLLGNNAINIVASALATSFAIHYFGDSGVVYSTFIMTLMVLIFAEIMPKIYAFYNAEKLALFVAPSLRIIVLIFAPITNVIDKIARLLLKLVGASELASKSIISGKEALRGAIDMHHEQGEVEKRDKDMLRGILDLSQTEVFEIMTFRRNMFTIDANLKTSEIVNLVLNSEYSRIPLWKDDPDNIIGIIHVKSLLRELRAHVGDVDMLDVMKIAKEPWFIPETNKLSQQLIQFRQKRNHIAVVVSEYGDIVGLVTLEDILEEIVGDIIDEHDTKIVGIRKQQDGGYKIKGDVTIRDINRKFDWDLPDDMASTLAGFLMDQCQDVPNEGEKIIYRKIEFEIIKRYKNQIMDVRVAKKKKRVAG